MITVPLPADRYFAYVIALEAERAVREFAEARDQNAAPPRIEFHRGTDPGLDLSIVIPAWNPKESHFARCLQSLKQADFSGLNYEIVVSDDASPSEIVKQCLDRAALPNALYVRQEKNLGGFGNFNWCIGAARGRWVHLLHQDDWIEPAFYQELLQGRANGSNAELRYVRTRLFYEDLGRTGLMFDEAPAAGILSDFFKRQCVSQRVQISGAVMGRAGIERVGGYDPRLGTGGDWEFWVRWGRTFPVFYSPRPLATFSLHGGSWASREESLGAHRAVLQRILSHVPAESRREVAAGFMSNMVSRLVGLAARNRKNNATHLNRTATAGLLVACQEASILPDVEKVLAALPAK